MQVIEVLKKHILRDTYEIAVGYRESNACIEEVARRELGEETGTRSFAIVCLGLYGVKGKTRVNTSGTGIFTVLFSRIYMNLEKSKEVFNLMFSLMKFHPCYLSEYPSRFPTICSQALTGVKKHKKP